MPHLALMSKGVENFLASVYRRGGYFRVAQLSDCPMARGASGELGRTGSFTACFESGELPVRFARPAD
jgi:hypothetical protein